MDTDPPRVADYFLVAGLPPTDPQLLDDSLEVNLRATEDLDPITDIAVSIQNCTMINVRYYISDFCLIGKGLCSRQDLAMVNFCWI